MTSYRREREGLSSSAGTSGRSADASPITVYDRRGYARTWREGSRMRPRSAPLAGVDGTSTQQLAISDNGTKQAGVSMPHSSVPERFHLREAGPLEETVGAVTFPSKAPTGRWEAVQLGYVLEQMCQELPAPPSWDEPSEADPEELLEHDLDDVFKRPWDVYSTVWQELVRHAWVHCTERGVLLEKVRLACDKIFGDCLGVAHRLQSYSKAATSPTQPVKRQAEELRQKVEELREENDRLKSELNSARADQRSAEAQKIRAEKRSEELSSKSAQADERANEAEADNRDLRASYQRSEHEKRRLKDALDSTRRKLEEESRQRESEVSEARAEATSWRNVTALACNAKADLPRDAANLVAGMGLPHFARFITLVDKATARYLLNGLSLKQQASVISELGDEGYLFLDVSDPTNTARLLASLQDATFAASLLSQLDEHVQASLINVLSQKHVISTRLQQHLSRQAQLLQPIDHNPTTRLEAPLGWVLRLLPTSLEPAHSVSSLTTPSWPTPAGRNPDSVMKLSYLDLASPDAEPILDTKLDLSLPYAEERLLCLLARMPNRHALLVATCGHFPVASLTRCCDRLKELGADLSDMSASSALALACGPSEGHLQAVQGGLDTVLGWDGRTRQYRLVSQASLPDVKCTSLLKLVAENECQISQHPDVRIAIDIAAKATLSRNIHQLRRIFISYCIGNGETNDFQLLLTPKMFYELCKQAKLKVKEKATTKLASSVAKAHASSDAKQPGGSPGTRGKAKKGQTMSALDFNNFLEALVQLTVQRSPVAAGSTVASTSQAQSQQKTQNETRRTSQPEDGVKVQDSADSEGRSTLDTRDEMARGAHALESLRALVEDTVLCLSATPQRGGEITTNDTVQSVIEQYEHTIYNVFSHYADADDQSALSMHAILKLAKQAGLQNNLSLSTVACAFYDVAIACKDDPSERSVSLWTGIHNDAFHGFFLRISSPFLTSFLSHVVIFVCWMRLSKTYRTDLNTLHLRHGENFKELMVVLARLGYRSSKPDAPIENLLSSFLATLQKTAI